MQRKLQALRPFFTYYGGKYRTAPEYPKPEYETIIEPFAGSAGYSLRHHHLNIILVEKSDILVALWKYLIHVSACEILQLPDVHPYQTLDDLTLIPEAKILIGFWLNKGNSSPCKQPSKWMRDGTHSNSFWGTTIRQRIASQVDKIRHWKIINGDYSDAPDIECTWFVDPPYIIAGKHYKHSLKEINYEYLAAWAVARKGQVIVCENNDALWLPFEPFIVTHGTAGSYRSGVSKEALWTNRAQS